MNGMDPSGSKRLDEIEASLRAIAQAIEALELIGSQRIDALEADAFERFNGIDRSLLGIVEALQTIAAKLDEEL